MLLKNISRVGLEKGEQLFFFFIYFSHTDTSIYI